MAVLYKIDDFDFILIFNAFKAENRILLSVSEFIYNESVRLNVNFKIARES